MVDYTSFITNTPGILLTQTCCHLDSKSGSPQGLSETRSSKLVMKKRHVYYLNLPASNIQPRTFFTRISPQWDSRLSHPPSS
jgi:hypothetical protein